MQPYLGGLLVIPCYFMALDRRLMGMSIAYMSVVRGVEVLFETEEGGDGPFCVAGAGG